MSMTFENILEYMFFLLRNRSCLPSCKWAGGCWYGSVKCGTGCVIEETFLLSRVGTGECD